MQSRGMGVCPEGNMGFASSSDGLGWYTPPSEDVSMSKDNTTLARFDLPDLRKGTTAGLGFQQASRACIQTSSATSKSENKAQSESLPRTSSMLLIIGLTKAASRSTTNSKSSAEMSVMYLEAMFAQGPKTRESAKVSGANKGVEKPRRDCERGLPLDGTRY